MRLSRRPPTAPTRRQKLAGDDLAPPPSTFSYRARRSEDSRGTDRQLGAEQQANRPAGSHVGHFWLQRFGLIVLLVALMASAVNVLSLSTAAKVVPLTATGSHSLLQPINTYQNAVDQQLGHSIWNRNKITVNTGQLSDYLLNRFPELASVSVTVPLLAHRPVVYVEPADPALVLTTSQGAFVVATSGKALSQAATPAALQQPTLPVVSDQSGLTIKLNRQAVSADNISFIQTVIGELAAKQFTVSNMTLPSATNELDVHLNGQPYFVKFNLQSSNPRGEAGTFLATIAQLHRQNVTPGQYVDVRVDGRAYYK